MTPQAMAVEGPPESGEVVEESDDQPRSVTDMVEQPAKVMRIGSMIRQLLEEVKAAPLDPTVPNIEGIGRLLYSRYLFVFEGAGLVLLVAMIGAIVLTYRERGGVRRQSISSQINRRAKDSTRTMQPTVGQGVEL